MKKKSGKKTSLKSAADMYAQRDRELNRLRSENARLLKHVAKLEAELAANKPLPVGTHVLVRGEIVSIDRGR